MNDEIYVLLCYCDTEEKLSLLRKNIAFLKSINKKIFISSHFAVPPDIQDSVDYCFFDKENEILLYERGDFKKYNISLSFFDCLDNAHVEGSFLYSHSYAVWDLMRKATNIASFLNYERIHFLNYDCILKSDSLINLNNFLLKTFDSIYYYFNDNEMGFFCSFLSFRVNMALQIFNYFKTLDEYYLNEWESPGLELVLHRLSEKINQNKIVFPHFFLNKNVELLDGFYLNSFLHCLNKTDYFYFGFCLNSQTNQDCIILQKIIDFSSCKMIVNGVEYLISFNGLNRIIIDLQNVSTDYNIIIKQEDQIIFSNQIKKLTHLSAKKL
jgi:hypothetical protein